MHSATVSEGLVKELAQPCYVSLRPDWRNGSDTMRALKGCDWWKDYQHDMEKIGCDEQDSTWVQWCYNKMIIGPPRYRSNREIAESGLDDEYLMFQENFSRHWLATFRYLIV